MTMTKISSRKTCDTYGHRHVKMFVQPFHPKLLGPTQRSIPWVRACSAEAFLGSEVVGASKGGEHQRVEVEFRCLWSSASFPRQSMELLA